MKIFYVCVHIKGVRNVRFSENLACFVFLLPLFCDSSSWLITNDTMSKLRCRYYELPVETVLRSYMFQYNEDSDDRVIHCSSNFFFLGPGLNLISLRHTTEAAVHRYSSKQVFLKICNIHRETPVLESFFNKVASLKACSIIKKKVQYRCFAVNIAKCVRTTFFYRPPTADSDTRRIKKRSRLYACY